LREFADIANLHQEQARECRRGINFAEDYHMDHAKWGAGK
jgi:hypothetical protein